LYFLDGRREGLGFQAYELGLALAHYPAGLGELWLLDDAVKDRAAGILIDAWGDGRRLELHPAFRSADIAKRMSELGRPGVALQLAVGLGEQPLDDVLRQELVAKVVAVEILVVGHFVIGIVHGDNLPGRTDGTIEPRGKPLQGLSHGSLTIGGADRAFGDKMVVAEDLDKVLEASEVFELKGGGVLLHN